MGFWETLGKGLGAAAGGLAGLIPGVGPFVAPFTSAMGSSLGGAIGAEGDPSASGPRMSQPQMRPMPQIGRNPRVQPGIGSNQGGY